MQIAADIRSTCGPTVRPLLRSLLVALATLPAATVMAGDLDGQTAEVVAGDAIEAWALKNGSLLSVNGGQTEQIQADDTSQVLLDNAQVTRSGNQTAAIQLWEQASLNANASRINGEVELGGGSTSLTLKNSAIRVTAAELDAGAQKSVGIGLSQGLDPNTRDTPYALVDNTSIYVDDLAAPTRPHNSGLGVRLMVGQMDIVNRSQIVAANVGAVLWGERNGDGLLRLNVNDSALQSGRGAAIQVMPMFDNTYDITVANDAHLTGGDGNLLLVGRAGSVSGARTDVYFAADDSRLIGNVTFDPTSVTNGSLDVILRNNAQIDGRFFNVTSATIDTDSAWLMTGDSNVGHLTLGSTSTVALGDGSRFNNLSVDTFTGNGGTLGFNTVLGDDTSATDKLIIAGDANGQANVRVHNAGGAGAKTDKGIELIRVGGASNAQFDLQGRAVGGQYEYFLFKDATNGGWYLRSELATTPDRAWPTRTCRSASRSSIRSTRLIQSPRSRCCARRPAPTWPTSSPWTSCCATATATVRAAPLRPMASVAGPVLTLRRASWVQWMTSWTCAWTARACSWVRTWVCSTTDRAAWA